ncbi:TPA: hypothetical protein I7674_03545 [Vibrio vulnificus]|nr:ATP-binding protein [Vibrio vulnificus]HAS8188269.1 hypothetical protein [Vibrio vulnificus]
MKIINVKVNKLYKYISTELNFLNDLSIITGVNGSGKTQILRLIDAVLALDIDYIEKVDFSRFSLTFEHDGEDFALDILKKIDKIWFRINSDTITIIRSSDLTAIFNREISIRETFINEYQKNITENTNSDFKVFSKIKRPLFLGLTRLVKSAEETNILKNKSDLKKEYWRKGRLVEGATSNNEPMQKSVLHSKLLILEEYEQIKRYEDAQSNVLRNNIITSSFDYLEDVFPSYNELIEKLNSVYYRKGSIIEELEKLKINDYQMHNKINRFFEKMDRIKSSYEEKPDSKKSTFDDLAFELLLNLSQIERVSKIISIIDEHKKVMDVKREKFDSFTRTVNKFFELTNKKIVINNLGQTYVVVNEKHKVNLENLSSGEMQLISIIANMVFCKNNNKGLIVIIDEPEISLHIKWQEMFIATLESIKKDAQLILATHSPDIIGDNTDFCLPIRNNNQKDVKVKTNE